MSSEDVRALQRANARRRWERANSRCPECQTLIDTRSKHCRDCKNRLARERSETPHDRIRRLGHMCRCGVVIIDGAEHCRTCGPKVRLGGKVVWGDKEIVAGLRQFGLLHDGRMPTLEEIAECDYLPAPITIRRRFGGQKEAAEMAGLTGGDAGVPARTETTPSVGRHDRSRQMVTGGFYRAKRDIIYVDTTKG